MLAAAQAVVLSATERGGISRAIDDFEEAVLRFGIVDRRATRLACCDTLKEARIVIESWRRHDKGVRPHASLGYRPPAPEVFVPASSAWPAALTRPAPPAKLPVEQTPTLH